MAERPNLPESNQRQALSTTWVHPDKPTGAFKLGSEPVRSLGDALHDGSETGLSVSDKHIVLSDDLSSRFGEVERKGSLQKE